MSWLYSRALVEDCLQAKSSDGKLSAQLRAIDMQQAYLFADKTKGIWSPFRFGITYAHLKAGLGGGLLTWFLGGFPAKISPSQEAEMELKERNQTFGWRWQESLVKYDHDTCSWRTRQPLLLGGWERFSETWPRWGTMRNGESWERTMPVRLTNGIGSGSLLPTPQSRDWKDTGPTQGNRNSINLGTWVHRYPTPTGSDLKHKRTRYKQGGRALSYVIGGKLNPNWVEWLMGWPVGWTDCEPLETGKFQSWLQQCSKHL